MNLLLAGAIATSGLGTGVLLGALWAGWWRDCDRRIEDEDSEEL